MKYSCRQDNKYEFIFPDRILEQKMILGKNRRN